MAKNTTKPSIIPVVMLTILTILIATIGALILFNIITIPGINTPATPEQADLRFIALPYLESTDIKEACLINGGVWHEDADFVGCVGYGPQDCTTEVTLSGMTQCIATGANWTCSPSAIYCRYD